MHTHLLPVTVFLDPAARSVGDQILKIALPETSLDVLDKLSLPTGQYLKTSRLIVPFGFSFLVTGMDVPDMTLIVNKHL